MRFPVRPNLSRWGFGGELTRLMDERGIGTNELARRSHYTAGHISNLRSGAKNPSPECAAGLDAILGAGGELIALGPAAGTAAFCARLRELLDSRGWTLGELGRRSHYDKSYLSKVMRGLKSTSPVLAGHLDVLLGAGGELAALVPPPVPRPPVTQRASRRPQSDADGGELAGVIRELSGRIEALTEALSAAAGSRAADAGAAPPASVRRAGLYLVPHPDVAGLMRLARRRQGFPPGFL